MRGSGTLARLQEIEYLMKQSYTLSDDGTQMLSPGG